MNPKRLRAAWLAASMLAGACFEAPAEPVVDAVSVLTWDDVARTTPPPCPRLEQAITEESMRGVLEPLAEVARRSGGHRAHGTGGYEGSVSYVIARLGQSGLVPARYGFDVARFEVAGPSQLEVRALPFRDHVPLRGSPPGDVTAEVAAVAVELGLGNASRSGCAPWDFDDGTGRSKVAGKIALMQRGSCAFGEKVVNAMAAGAVGALIFNQGDTWNRRGLMEGVLEGRGVAHGITIPALFIATHVGEHIVGLLERGPLEAHMNVDTTLELSRAENVILEIPGERPEVLMLGAHLDSVSVGPGMNDNASGSAALLAIAEQLHGCAMERTVRFAWWGAEELGLLGSTAWLGALGSDERKRLVGYINLDMVAAPNHAFQLTDGDGSRSGTPGPASSAKLEAFFRADFAERNIPLLEVPFMFRSDDAPFYAEGFGVAMLGAGYDGKKTSREAQLFGGAAGQRHDPCYHRACDDMTNVNIAALTTIATSVARAVQHFVVEGKGLE